METDRVAGRQGISYAAVLLFMLILLLCPVFQAHAEDNELSYDRTLGDPGIMEDDLSKPMDVAMDSGGNVYVADTYHNRIVKYKEDGGFEAWGGPESGSADGRFFRPTGVAVSPEGLVYAVDSGNNRIQVFDKDGIHQFNIGGYGTAAGKFINPQGIAIDGAGALYVTEEGNARVQKLLADGTPVWRTPSDGSEFAYPVGIAISLDGNIYVSDILNNRIRVLDGDGDELNTLGWGSSGSGDSQFHMPYGLAFDQNNRLYVADRLNSRVQRFSASGTFLDQWDSTGWSGSDEDVFRPQGLEVSNKGELYVLDDYSGALHVFKPVPVAADLKALSIDEGELNPAFNPAVLLYQVAVTHDVYGIRLTPTPLEAGSAVTVDGTPVEGGQPAEAVNLPVGMTPIAVKVTSQDGLVQKTYTVQVTRPKSDNARLKAVTADKGRWNMDFDPGKIAYTITVDHEVTDISLTPVTDNPYATIKVNGEAHASGAPIGPVSIQVGGDNYIEIDVTAQNPIYDRRYRFQIWRSSSPDNNLSGLTTSTGSLSPVFNPDRTSYETTVSYETETIYATATAEEPNAAVEVFYENAEEERVTVDALHPLPLDVGDDNLLYIGVTAQNGWYKLYSVRVNREPSDQAGLSALAVDHGILSPAEFDPATAEYTVEVENDVEAVRITPTVEGGGMTVKVSGEEVTSGHASGSLPISVGSNTFEVVVTAMDGETAKTYVVKVVRAFSSDAGLAGLSVGQENLSPAFQADTLAYTVVTEHETDRIAFIPDPSEPHAEVSINGAATEGGTLSVPVALDVGRNQVDIVVTAQDGTTVRTYQVTVVRLLPGVTALERAGTEANPYVIADEADLDLMRFGLNGYYRLTSDLDMTGNEWIPVGSVTEPFAGGLDGNGHTISGLTVNRPEADYAGMFAAIDGADHRTVISNLTMTGAQITAKDHAGVIAGYLMNALLENVHVEGAAVQGGSFLGGFAGSAGRTAVLASYAADTRLSGESAAGGMFGEMQEMTIDQSYTSGSVSVVNFFAGGLAASSVSPNTITNVYSRSRVTGMGWIGGLVGFPTGGGDADAIEIKNSYAIGSVATSEVFRTGGLAADTLFVAAEHSYWVEERTGQAGSAIGTARTASEMKQLDTEGNWDFDEIWTYTSAGDYPQLRVFLSHNAELEDLQFNGGSLQLQPAFIPNVTSYALTVTNEVYEVTVTPSLPDAAAQVTVQGISVGDGEASAPIPLQVGENTIVVQVAAADQETVLAYTIRVVRTSAPQPEGQEGAGNDSGPSDPEPSDPGPSHPGPSDPGPSNPGPSGVQTSAPAGDGLEIVVNGKQMEQLASSSVAEEEGRTVARFHLFEDQLQAVLSEQADGSRITVSMPDEADTVIGELTGTDVKQLEEKEAVVEIVTNAATYTLPASEINIDEISLQLGETVSLTDIRVAIEIATGSGEDLAELKQLAQTGGYTVLTPPVSFHIQASYGDRKVEIMRFKGFVERSIRLPAGTQPNVVTTGVIFEADGGVRHVPTKVSQVNGIWYAQIRSLSNSMYAVIHNKRAFADMEGHWAAETVAELASRKVIKGTDADVYSPERAVTRAEFAAMLQRALGLPDEAAAPPFTDVGGEDWFAGAVSQMQEYGIIEGYADGSFRPDRTISREEAMVMTARVMAFTGPELIEPTADGPALEAYSDDDAVSGYARQAVALNVQHGIVRGDGGMLRPEAPITRAQTAAVLLRLLRHMELI